MERENDDLDCEINLTTEEAVNLIYQQKKNKRTTLGFFISVKPYFHLPQVITLTFFFFPFFNKLFREKQRNV